MEASGAQAKLVSCVVSGEPTKTLVVASADSVQIGEVVFKREELLLAIGTNEGDLKRLHGDQ